jgi:hypothetical protein
MCLNKTCCKVRIGKHSSDRFFYSKWPETRSVTALYRWLFNGDGPRINDVNCSSPLVLSLMSPRSLVTDGHGAQKACSALQYSARRGAYGIMDSFPGEGNSLEES